MLTTIMIFVIFSFLILTGIYGAISDIRKILMERSAYQQELDKHFNKEFPTK